MMNVNLNINTSTLFIKACLENDTKTFERLISIVDNETINSMIQKKRKREYKDFTPLLLAIEHGNCKMVELLLRYGADINMSNSLGSPLIVAMLCDEQKLFKYLIKNGATSIDSEYFDCLFSIIAKLSGSKEFVITWIKTLFQSGCDINCQDAYNQTPLHLAPAYTYKTLFQYGADINIENKFSETPLCHLKDCDGHKFKNNLNYFIDVYVHIEKLKLLNAYIHNQVLELYSFIEKKLRKYDEEQKYVVEKVKMMNEAETLKQIKIYPNFSLYDILFLKNINRFATLAKNKNLLQSVKEEDIEYNFQYFGVILLEKISKLKARNILVSLALTTFSIMTKNLFPISVQEEIFIYIDDTSLQKMNMILTKKVEL